MLNDEYSLQWGTSQASDYLLKLVQLKYPTFPTRVTPVQASVSASLLLIPMS